MSPKPSPNISFFIPGKPKVAILPVGSQKGQLVVAPGANGRLYCSVYGMPPATVSWLFQEVSLRSICIVSAVWVAGVPFRHFYVRCVVDFGKVVNLFHVSSCTVACISSTWRRLVVGTRHLAWLGEGEYIEFS